MTFSNRWFRPGRYGAAVMLIALSACGRTARLASTQQNFCPRSSATLYVTNDNWLDVVVYLYRGGSRYRIGQVTSTTSQVFDIPELALAGQTSIALVADPVGAVNTTYSVPNYYTTPSIIMAPGHTIIDLRVANVIDHSSVLVGVEDPEEL